MKEVHYKYFYSKLELEKYRTIRRHLKGRRVGDIEREYVNNKIWYAKIIKIKQKTLAEIPFNMLFNDCKPFAESRKECYELFQSFYKKPIDFEKESFFIFYMQKIELNIHEQDIIERSRKWLI